jgi:putative transposase
MKASLILGVFLTTKIMQFAKRSLSFFAGSPTSYENAGLLVIGVKASGTSQDCSNCSVKVPKKLHIRWHDCPHCGCSLDRDHNAAINIRKKAEGHPVFKAQLMSYAMAGVAEKPTLTRTEV